MPHVRFSWKAAPSIIVVDKRWLSALDGLFYNKGAPHSHAHNQTLMIMMNLGESNLSHTFIATSCPFQLCSRNWPVKMSKWSWQLWWCAIWDKWDQNNDEVADDVDADDRNICKAIAFLGFGTFPYLRNFWKKGWLKILLIYLAIWSSLRSII